MDVDEAYDHDNGEQSNLVLDVGEAEEGDGIEQLFGMQLDVAGSEASDSSCSPLAPISQPSSTG